MTNKEREVMVNLIRRSEQALVFTIINKRASNYYVYNEEFLYAMIALLKADPELLDDLKYCIEMIEKERILN